MKKTVYQVGDRVKVIVPKFVKRVGYNLHYEDLLEEVGEDTRTSAALDLLTTNPDGTRSSRPRFIPRDFLISIAKLRVQERGFGGKERALHYYEDYGLDYTGSILTVLKKRCVNTGTYYPPYIPSRFSEFEDEGEPGGWRTARRTSCC